MTEVITVYGLVLTLVGMFAALIWIGVKLARRDISPMEAAQQAKTVAVDYQEQLVADRTRMAQIEAEYQRLNAAYKQMAETGVRLLEAARPMLPHTDMDERIIYTVRDVMEPGNPATPPPYESSGDATFKAQPLTQENAE